MDEFKRIVEIGGVKIEVDLRTAKRVDQFRVGDAVKILKKKYSDTYESYFAMIVGFDEFKTLPTMIVAYIDPSTWETPLKFEYINAKTENAEICPHDPKDIGVEKADILAQFDRQRTKKEQELEDLKRKKEYFLAHFGRYFESETAQTA